MNSPEFVNDNFEEAVVLDIAALSWLPSPMAGVERKMLDRVGGEVARANSIVRFEAGHAFSPHTHGGGEEYLVLEGVFSDESGDYGAGWYVRNPPGSSHKPHSEEGCVIFVKLCQMRSSGEPSLAVNTAALAFQPVAGREGLSRKELFTAANWPEEVAIEELRAGARLEEQFVHGAELLLLEGALVEEDSFEAREIFPMSWLRFPYGGSASLAAKETSRYWIKRGVEYPVK